LACDEEPIHSAGSGFRRSAAPGGRSLRAAVWGLAVLAAVLLAPGGSGTAVAATYSSIPDWDVVMSDPAGYVSTCPAQYRDGKIASGECPDVTTNFWIQRAGGTGGSQSMFDRANVIWTTGPLAGDVSTPQHGLAPKQPANWGSKVGLVTIQMQSNLVVGALTQNNIDDVASGNDPTVAGQPPRCGADLNNDNEPDTLSLQDSFELWNAVPDDRFGIIPASESQLPDVYPVGCDGTRGHACAPRAVRKLPQPIVALESAMGLSSASRVSRAYGIAKLPIVAGISNNLDVNFLVYSLHGKGTNGYLSVTLIQYPGLPAPDPTYASYNPLSQAVQVCPPYFSSATIYGVTASADFNEDGTADLNVTAPEKNRVVVCDGPGCGSYDYLVEVSMVPDYDGDGIPAYADRCSTDATSGSAADDSDADGLSGTCDPSGQHNNPKGGSWKAKPPWDANQDRDGDGYLNSVDNCPTVPNSDQKDTDGDTVGDACDPAPTIPGDGKGYASPSPGTFVDYDDICRDPWTVGQAETSDDGGRQCLKRDGVITAWQDSNDDGTPDYVNLTPIGGGVMADCDSDCDRDGLVDAVEAAPPSARPCTVVLGKNSDPLDPSSPAAVGGVAELPLEPGSSAEQAPGTAIGISALVVLLVGCSGLLAAGGWYAKRRWRR